LLGIDNSVLNLAIPSLTADMRPSATQILWTADVYGFAMGALLIFMGNLGDRVGRKKLLLAGTIAFGLASVITAYATSPGLLIGARALLGIAGAAIMPSTLSLIRNTFTEPAERTMAMGISGGVGAGGFALGPIVGGVLLDHFWWGSVFLINVPVMLLVLGFGTVVLPESRNPRPGRLDLVSVPLSVVGMIGVTYAIKAAARDGAAEPTVWITAAIGVVALVVFVRRQTRLAEPLLDVKLFRNPAFSGSVGSNLITIFSLSALSLIFAQYFQVVRGWSPLTSGLALLLGPVGAMIGGPLVTLLIGKWGRARVVSVGLGLMAVSMVGLSRVGTDSSYAVLAVPLLLNGIGLGFTFGTTNDTMLATAPKERAGGASAIGETAMEAHWASPYSDPWRAPSTEAASRSPPSCLPRRCTPPANQSAEPLPPERRFRAPRARMSSPPRGGRSWPASRPPPWSVPPYSLSARSSRSSPCAASRPRSRAPMSRTRRRRVRRCRRPWSGEPAAESAHLPGRYPGRIPDGRGTREVSGHPASQRHIGQVGLTDMYRRDPCGHARLRLRLRPAWPGPPGQGRREELRRPGRAGRYRTGRCR
ncbi:MAG: transporter, family, multidrug resistance protein, partial [Streptomycetaceae bacterium]|nr:transporter, family, multidrug resistance protein [Streptomycetaceae bacterium]